MCIYEIYICSMTDVQYSTIGRIIVILHALMRAILHALMRRWIGTCDLKQYYAVCGIVAELQCGVSVNLKLFMKNGNNYANVV